MGKYGPLGLPAGARGKWTSENEFQLDLNFIANINHYTLAIKFTPDKTIEVTADEASGLMRNGHLVGYTSAGPAESKATPDRSRRKVGTRS